MRTGAFAAMLVVLVAAQARADGDDKLPSEWPPAPVLASLDTEGHILLRMRRPEYQSAGAKPEEGKPGRTEPEVTWHDETYTLNPGDVRVYEAGGKELERKAVLERLRKETLGLYAFGDKVDPAYLRTIKDGTLIFVYVRKAEGTSVSEKRAAEPASARVPGLADLLKKEGYVAIPLERLGSGHLAVRVQIQGKKFLLGVDTGAWQTALDRYRVRQLGLEWNDDAQAVVDGITVGDFETGKLTVGAHDMTDNNRAYRAYSLPPIDGLLGADVFRPYAAVIDHAGAVLYLRKPEPKK